MIVNKFMPNAIRVIVIADDELDMMTVRRLLEFDSTNFVLKWENCLQDGIKTISESPFDVVLLDLGLPDSYGIDSIKRIVEEFGQLAIIVLSTEDDEYLTKASLELGIEAFLVKGEKAADAVATTIVDVVKRNGKFARQNSNLIPTSSTTSANSL